MKTIISLALTALLCGCGQKITGAFGWKLGEKLPLDKKLDGGQVFFDTNCNTPPFDSVTLCVATDRTIRYISASANASKKDEVMQALQLKYGNPELRHSTNGDSFIWKSGSRQVFCNASDKYVFVSYVDSKLEKDMVKKKESPADLAKHL